MRVVAETVRRRARLEAVRRPGVARARSSRPRKRQGKSPAQSARNTSSWLPIRIASSGLSPSSSSPDRTSPVPRRHLHVLSAGANLHHRHARNDIIARMDTTNARGAMVSGVAVSERHPPRRQRHGLHCLGNRSINRLAALSGRIRSSGSAVLAVMVALAWARQSRHGRSGQASKRLIRLR